MTENKSMDILKEMLMIIVVMSAYTLISILYMPYILILIPAPFIVFSLKANLKLGIISFISTSIISSIFLGPAIGLIYLIIFLPLIIIYNILINGEGSINDILFKGSVAIFISILAINIMSGVNSEDFSKDIKENTQVLIEEQVERLEELDYSKAEIEDMRETLELGYESFLTIIPAILLIIAFIINYINLHLTAIGLERIDKYIVNGPKLARFKLPRDIFVGTLFVYLLVFILARSGITYTNLIISNYSLLLGFIILLQGLGVVSYRLDRRGTNSIIKGIIFISFIVFLPILFIIYIIGLMDVFFDFRKIRT